MQTTFGWPGVEVTVENTDELVHPGGSELNPEWKYVDQQGHGHFVVDTKDRDGRLPTLTWVSEPCTYGHDDCDAEGHYECATCGEEVQPGTRDARPFLVRGARTYTLTTLDDGRRTTYRFGQDGWDALQDAIAEAVRASLAPLAWSADVEQVGPSRMFT